MRFGFVAATLAIALGGCSGGGAPPAQSAPGAARPPVPVLVEAVRRQNVERAVSLVGTLYGDEEALISAKVPGRIRKIMADLGDVVSGGTEIAELELEDYKLSETVAERALEAVLARLGTGAVPDAQFQVDGVATVARAQAELANAKAKRERLTGLREKDPGFVTKQTLDDADTTVSVAAANVDVERLAARALVAESHQRQADLDIARRRLADAQIAAPGGPRRWAVAARLASEGEYLKEGMPLFRLVAADVLKLRAAAPERYSPEFRIGQAARVRVEAFGDRPFAGEISRINPSVDLQSRTFGVEILVPNKIGANRKGELMPGFFARAEVVTGREDVLLVPLDSLVSFAGITKVFVVEGSAARERIVEPGLRHGRLIEVKGALSEQASVITRGAAAVADGSAVRVAESAPSAAAVPAAVSKRAEIAR